jgi:hypothetical protein
MYFFCLFFYTYKWGNKWFTKLILLSISLLCWCDGFCRCSPLSSKGYVNHTDLVFFALILVCTLFFFAVARYCSSFRQEQSWILVLQRLLGLHCLDFCCFQICWDPRSVFRIRKFAMLWVFLARKGHLCLLCFIIGGCGTWICLCWQSVHLSFHTSTDAYTSFFCYLISRPYVGMMCRCLLWFFTC